MTISATTNRLTFSANGTTTQFAWPYYFEAAADIKLIVVDEDDWSFTVPTQGVDYNVTGFGELTGGTITSVGTYGTNKTLIAYNEPALVQDFDADPYGSFGTQIPTVEGRLDRLTIITQRLLSLANRSVRLGDNNFQGINLDFPGDMNGSASLLADRLPMFGSAGTSWASVSQWPTGSSILAAASAGSSAANAAAAAAISEAAAIAAGSAATAAAAAANASFGSVSTAAADALAAAGTAVLAAGTANSAAGTANLAAGTAVLAAGSAIAAAGTAELAAGTANLAAGTANAAAGTANLAAGTANAAAGSAAVSAASINLSGSTGIVFVTSGTLSSIGTLSVSRGGIGVGTVGSDAIMIGAGTAPVTSIGTLNVARGGIGVGTIGSGSVLFGAGTAPVTTAGTVSVSSGGLGVGTLGSTAIMIGAGTAPVTTIGTLDVARGGTGVGTIGSGSVLVGAGTGAFTGLAPGTATTIIVSNGTTWVVGTQSGGGAGVTTVLASYKVSATGVITNGVPAIIPVGTEITDTHSALGTNAQFIVPSGQGGWYQVEAVAGCDSTVDTGLVEVSAYVNGVQIGNSASGLSSTTTYLYIAGIWTTGSVAVGGTISVFLGYAQAGDKNTSGIVTFKKVN